MEARPQAGIYSLHPELTPRRYRELHMGRYSASAGPATAGFLRLIRRSPVTPQAVHRAPLRERSWHSLQSPHHQTPQT